jgi:hypothetical protein
MPTDETELRAAVDAYQRRAQWGRTADVVATILLLTAHGVLIAVTMGLLGVLAMGTDPCAYQNCGDPAWINRAVGLGLGGGAAVFVLTLVVALRRLARRRTAFFVPLIGCAVQVALATAATAMESLAGPV